LGNGGKHFFQGLKPFLCGRFALGLKPQPAKEKSREEENKDKKGQEEGARLRRRPLHSRRSHARGSGCKRKRLADGASLV